ncbi:MAG: PCRF domain-containing protein, partial [Oscillospiraceae bacterium]|nr:PCRF domain-containing protein [Oscillospiraceae bacterium]
MFIPDEYKQRLNDARNSANEVLVSVDVDDIQKQLAEIDEQVSAPDFWNDQQKSKAVFAKQSALKGKLNRRNKLLGECDDAETIIAIAEESDEDELLLEEIEQSLTKLEATVQEVTMALLLSGEYDRNNAIITIHAGAGGTEAQDWAQMLY